jgi:hypothetical protein
MTQQAATSLNKAKIAGVLNKEIARQRIKSVRKQTKRFLSDRPAVPEDEQNATPAP